MAQRRMFSPQIVSSDAYLDMPVSSRDYYFQLNMNADDDGFVDPRKVMRMCGASEDDLKLLIAKGFAIPFESGIVVIKHWLIHNLIRSDRYKETTHLEEKVNLIIQDNKRYSLATNWQPTGNQRLPQVKLGKVKLGKVKLISKEGLKKQFWTNPLFEKIKEKYPDRDYEFHFEEMCQWYLLKKDRLPIMITAFTKWLSSTKPDELLQAERRRRIEKEALDRKQQILAETPRASEEKVQAMRDKMKTLTRPI